MSEAVEFEKLEIGKEYVAITRSSGKAVIGFCRGVINKRSNGNKYGMEDCQLVKLSVTPHGNVLFVRDYEDTDFFDTITEMDRQTFEQRIIDELG